jgi:pyruvate/2-oxoglutarate dehydrogenase complex dihydrolipoamide dehydrogenase (E3) component
MPQHQHYDLIILGAGSAGYWAARTAGATGKKIALLDPGPLGGLCILRGCMPTKAMLRSSEVLHLAKTAHEVGVLVKEVGYDFEAIMARKAHWVADFASYRAQGILKQQGFEFIQGAGRFRDAHTIEVNGERLTADKFIVATGSTPFVPSVPGLREVGFITSAEALYLKAPPESMVILGGGVIALELGQFFARLGVKVTFVLRGDRILSGEDEDVALAMQQCLLDEGITILERVHMARFERRGDRKVLVGTRDGAPLELECAEVMVTLGRVPNIDKIDLPLGGVHCGPHLIEVNEHLQTNQPHIYATGDVTGRHFIVHVAIQEGIHAAKHAMGLADAGIDYRLMAWAIYSDPNVARVGLSEREAERRGIPVVTGSYPFDDQGKALVANLTKGFVKVVAHADTGEIVGAAVVGAEGADLIHELIVAMHFRSTCEQFLAIPHLHPTLSEIWLDAVEACQDQILERRAAAVSA